MFSLKCMIRKKRILRSVVIGGDTEYDWNGKLRFFPELFLCHGIAVTLVILSVVLSLFAFWTENPDYFGRFGAFFVLAAVWLSHSVNQKVGTEVEAKAFSEMFDVATDAARKFAVEAAHYSGTRSAFTPRLPQYQKQPKGMFIESATKISSDGAKRKRPFIFLELLLGVWGTVQWSFGDEIIRKLCEGKPC